MRAKFTDDDGKHNLTINFEVCRIEGLSDVIGVRPKRIKGDTWLYKKVLVGCLCGDGGALESIEARRRFFSVSAESKLRHGEYSCVSTCVRACVRACVVCSVWSISLSSCDCRQSNTGWFPLPSFFWLVFSFGLFGLFWLSAFTVSLHVFSSHWFYFCFYSETIWLCVCPYQCKSCVNAMHTEHGSVGGL